MDVGTGVPVLKDSNEPAPGTGGPSNFTTRYASGRGAEEKRLASDGSIVRKVSRRVDGARTNPSIPDRAFWVPRPARVASEQGYVESPRRAARPRAFSTALWS